MSVGMAALSLPMILSGPLYIAPSLIGSVRGVNNLGSLIVLNIVLGWACLGLVVSLALAFATEAQPTSRERRP